MPVGMGSVEELTATFQDLTERIKVATAKLWREMAGWTRDQQLDAGALTYYAVIKEFAMIAGCYEMEDWMMIDERAERFRPFLSQASASSAPGTGGYPNFAPRTSAFAHASASDATRSFVFASALGMAAEARSARRPSVVALTRAAISPVGVP